MPEMKTTVEALRWALSEIETLICRMQDLNSGESLDAEASRNLSLAQKILVLSEFVESDVTPDYSKDGGFDTLIDTTPAAYAMPEQK